jgi:hypothetical protein
MLNRVLAVGLILLLSPVPALAQSCAPAAMEYLLWGDPGQGIVAGEFVPVGEVWKIRAAGIATDDGRQLEWMMQIQHTLKDGQCCWLIPLHRQTGTSGGTPVLAIEREIILTTGERLASRVNGLALDKRQALLYVGWRFPVACLPRLLGVQDVAIDGSGGPAPDLSALRAALTEMAAAAHAAAESVP